MTNSFIITGVVINQTFIIESKGWEKFAMAKSFMIYSILTVATLFFSGFLVDKFTSRKIFPILNIPLLLSVIILAIFDHPYSVYIFMGLMGISNGLTPMLRVFNDTARYVDQGGGKRKGSFAIFVEPTKEIADMSL